MNNEPNTKNSRAVYIAQLLSVLLIWVFVLVISFWILNLILLAIELNDAPGASVAISIVAIPVFITLASVLTYVFVGLHKEKHRTSTSNEEK
ncbi:MAG: hypothetical protein HYY49_03260 [Ignavibacteriales bacterium]|nr:hypothetical protein [Ignavibacteriales bacterium]